MSDEQTPSKPVTQAELVGSVSAAVMRTVIDFAKGIEQYIAPRDTARIYMGAGAGLASTIVGRDGAIAMLRQLADTLEKSETATMN